MVARAPSIVPTLCAALCLGAATLPEQAGGGVPSGAEVSGFVLTQAQGTGTLTIRSGQAVYEGRETVVLTDVTAQLSEKGVTRVTVAGKQGRYEDGKKVLLLEGSVTVVTAEGYRLACPSVEWDGLSGVLRGAGGVRVTKDGLVVRGPRFEHSASQGRTVIRGGVTASIDLGGRGR